MNLLPKLSALLLVFLLSCATTGKGRLAENGAGEEERRAATRVTVRTPPETPRLFWPKGIPSLSFETRFPVIEKEPPVRLLWSPWIPWRNPCVQHCCKVNPVPICQSRMLCRPMRSAPQADIGPRFIRTGNSPFPPTVHQNPVWGNWQMRR